MTSKINKIVNGPIPDSFLFDESKRLDSLKFDGTNLEVLDQLLLPHEFKYIPVEGVSDAFAVIKSMQVRGAPLIAVVGSLGLLLEIQKASELDSESIIQKINFLISSRPTAVDLRNSLNGLKPILESQDYSDVVKLEKCRSYLLNVYTDEKLQNRILVWNAYQELLSAFPDKEKLTVMTICNTGSLATISWGTALGVIRALHSENRLKLVYVLETRPYNQGIRLTSIELLHGEVPFKLITDSMAAWAMKNHQVDCVLTGADNVARNGDTANKIGTYMLAVLCKHHNINFYPVVPFTTINKNIATGEEIKIEERPSAEMLRVNGVLIGNSECPVWNPAFDVTPAHLITKILTDFGNWPPEMLEQQIPK
ncbi:Methylthioribose-1-phosphate isomerase [Caenorhabditis elegans]|uniref:Methylthioribose-1-phosphate isomerase n=1 Tax=Caenorhabditis elegans TaxID=6239 RepID=MTNA_CAEEL|nr:Methylthioribose-1-phosphate isomerase [Caenorhabditis elegans]Q93169.1 RecName: Full=Methylthioribose-1-phosphate isomerase; Short=M1Pi; Short=MTR-1-P isomerase; AltName: Full=S-methyl-5-thioribose-1-phosphate isomerase; AltName: Full=Translation initiation factor eIF-2B subunit alpha/beta/delta-like protein [Caenorhabditis elegans]CAB02711.1 Methylthioribose-1-phosphate isomerase [Caenorhabditis elegans]|eukprot:NP_506714.1 Methylthioribose-1-phosphate isomerase [Caenorhabditis elegans]